MSEAKRPRKLDKNDHAKMSRAAKVVQGVLAVGGTALAALLCKFVGNRVKRK